MLLAEVDMGESQGRVDQWLEALSGKLDSAVDLDLQVVIAGLNSHRAIVELAISDSSALGLEGLKWIQFPLNIHPEADVVVGDVLPRAVEMVDDSVLELLERRVRANLCPPLLHHVLGHIVGDHGLTVDHLDGDRLQPHLHAGVEVARLPDIEPLNGLSTISLEQKGPDLLVEDGVPVVTLAAPALLDVLVDVVSLHTLDLASTVEIGLLLVLLTELVSIHHHARMFRGEMSLLVIFELVLRQIVIELVIQDEVIILQEPLGGDQVSRRAGFQIGRHVVLLLE